MQVTLVRAQILNGRSRKQPRRLELETLEERQMLSITIAALGDSLTDEYQFYAPYRTAALNWPEILGALRSSQINMGSFTPSTRGETRNQGYSQDWARSSATASGTDLAGAGTTFINQYNGGFTPGSPGLLTQPGGISGVNAVNILIGGNDYLRAVEQSVLNLSQTPQNFQNANTGIMTAIQTVVPLIEQANPNTRIILDTVPNITNTAIFKQILSVASGTVGNLVTAVITNYVNMVNQEITTYATTNGLGLVDINGLFQSFLANPVIDGAYINPLGSGPLYTDMFVGDGFHPGTIVQGILANAIIGQVDRFFPGAVTPLTDSQILALAQQAEPVTQATLTVSAGTATPQTPVTLTASVATFPPNYETSNVPPLPNNLYLYPAATGSVTFVDQANRNRIIGIAQLGPTGVATLSVPALGPGFHSIVAYYGGNTIYPPTTTSPESVVVGSPAQVRVLNFLDQLERRIEFQASRPQIDRWLGFLKRGYTPRQVARAILHFVARRAVLHPHGASSGPAGRSALPPQALAASKNAVEVLIGVPTPRKHPMRSF